MKKLFFLLFFICFFLNINGQVLKTINVVTPGTLSTMLTVTEKSTITDLTVTGDIDARDIKCIRDEMPGRTRIDLSNANIQAYSGLGGTFKSSSDRESDAFTDYPANTLPQKAFKSWKQITSVIVYLCHNINTIILPKSIKSLGYSCFEGCSGLTSITLPEISSIGNSAFYKCGRLKQLTIPTSVTNIGSFAFSGSGLSELFIPSTVTNVADEAFYGSYVLISVDSDNPNYSSHDGILFNKYQTRLISFPTTKTGTYTIPSTVSTIGRLSFSMSRLTSLTIPSTVTNIESSSFSGFNYDLGMNYIEIRSLTVESPTPIDLTNTTYVFGSLLYGTLYVPSGSKSAYLAANQWKDFTNIIEYTTAVPSVIDGKVKIYPSVVTDGFRISGIANSVKATLFDINGKELLSKSVTENEFVSLGSISPGFYIVKIMTTEGIIDRKIIKL